MTDEKKNVRAHFVQTLLLSITTAGVLGCFGFMWKINNFMIEQAAINANQITVNNNQASYNTEFRNSDKYLDAQINNNNIRISVLETEKKNQSTSNF